MAVIESSPGRDPNWEKVVRTIKDCRSRNDTPNYYYVWHNPSIIEDTGLHDYATNITNIFKIGQTSKMDFSDRYKRTILSLKKYLLKTLFLRDKDIRRDTFTRAEALIPQHFVMNGGIKCLLKDNSQLCMDRCFEKIINSALYFAWPVIQTTYPYPSPGHFITWLLDGNDEFFIKLPGANGDVVDVLLHGFVNQCGYTFCKKCTMTAQEYGSNWQCDAPNPVSNGPLLVSNPTSSSNKSNKRNHDEMEDEKKH